MNPRNLNGILCSAIVCGLMAGVLTACGGGGGAAAPAVVAAPTTVSCSQLTTVAIPATAIGLPTNGGAISAAQTIPASGSGATAVGAYCLASGIIKPVDPAAPNIQFQVALPATWNSKVLMFGGGGYDGTIPDVTGNYANAPTGASTPLAQGFVVFASDSGHQAQAGNTFDASFTTNQEAYRNWIGDALKKTHDAALILVNATYGTPIARSYFIGGSTGGREALTVAGRWPADWDGVVALYPARDVTAGILRELANAQAYAAPGAFLDAAKRGVLYTAALAACDALDGASDGVISNVQTCNAIFDPTTAQVNGVPVRCPGGADTGDTCLSDAQLGALQAVNSPISFNFPLASGQASYPGYNVLLADNGIPSTSPLQPEVTILSMGFVAPAFPASPYMSFGTQFAASFIGEAVVDASTGITDFDYLTLDVSNPGPFASRLSELSALDTGDEDLSGFAAKGGKLLLMHGTADMLVSPRATELYFQSLQATMGADNVDTFLRFYEVPGFAHLVSAQFNVAWDQLTAIENWVEQGIDPATNQIVTDTAGVPGRTRPLCLYPTWPQYTGSGDVNSAASFKCVSN